MQKNKPTAASVVPAPVIVPRNLNVTQAAVYLGCTIWCLRSLAWEGKLKPLTLGKRLLFPRELLDAFIEQQKSAVN